MNIDNLNYLIIGGSTKCGTTSVFKYFEFHPEVCPCTMKESRYFLGDSYLLIAAKRNHDKYTNFGELFKKCDANRLRLEATPDYLYSKPAIQKIKQELSNCKLVFILRDPIDRLLSWYKFALLNGMIEKSLPFEEFLKLQSEEVDENAPQHLRSLEQGKYFSYLKNYLTEFGSGNIHICFYEDLQKNARLFCKNICAFSGVNPEYYDDFNFIIHNKSVPVKSVIAHKWFRKMKHMIRPVARMMPPVIHKKLKLAGYKVEQVYTAANEDTTSTEIFVADDLIDKLRNYYHDDSYQISKLTGMQVPWKNFKTL